MNKDKVGVLKGEPVMFQMSSDQLLKMYEGFVSKYPVVSIEDAFDQDDWDAWSKMCGGVKIQLVG